MQNGKVVFLEYGNGPRLERGERGLEERQRFRHMDQNVTPYRGNDGSLGTEIDYARPFEGDVRGPLLEYPLAGDLQSRFVDVEPVDPTPGPTRRAAITDTSPTPQPKSTTLIPDASPARRRSCSVTGSRIAAWAASLRRSRSLCPIT